MSLFAFLLTPEQGWIIALAMLATFAIVGWISHLIAWKVAERKKIRSLGTLLTQYGFTDLGAICQDLADEDFPAAVKEIEYLARQLQSPGTAVALLSSVGFAQIPAIVADPTNCKTLLKKLFDWQTANPQLAKAAGYAITALAAA
jgi:hypothetical protein